MIGNLVRTSVVAFVALAPASTGAARRPVALTAAPARVVLAGGTRATVRVTNSGTKRVLVDASRAGFALDLRGRPRIVRNGGVRSAARWLSLHPTRFGLAPHATASLIVAAKLPRRAEPGDHDALVLLSTRPLETSQVAVRLRVGVVVVVRAPGKVVRRLEVRALRVVRRGRRRALELVVANRGNVTESLKRLRAALVRRGHHIAVLVSVSRDLRPGTSGVVEFRLRARVHGWMTVRVAIPAAYGRSALRRTYRIRL